MAVNDSATQSRAILITSVLADLFQTFARVEKMHFLGFLSRLE